MADSQGPLIADFLQRFCRHPRGPLAGQPVVPVDEQKQVLNELFALDENGLWAYREGLIMVHRKWAKSLISSGAGLFTLVTKGMGTEVYMVANSRAQAGILKKNADMFAVSSQALRKRLWVYRHKIETPHGSHLMVLGADAHQAHGYNPQLSLIDEYWAFRRNELPEALASGAAARDESMTLYITTPGVDMNTPLGRLVERFRRGDPTLYVHWPGQYVPMDIDVYDEKAWTEFNIGYRHGWVSKQFLISQAHSLPRHEFVRLHLGGWLQSSAGWLDMGKFDRCKDDKITLDPGAEVVVFIDGAWKHDSVAIVACTLQPVPELFVMKVWEKPVGDDAWRVPYYEIDRVMRDIVDRFKVRLIGADPFFLGQMLQSWQESGLPVQEVPTNSVSRAVDACKRFYDAIVETRLKWDGNHILRRHMANCQPKQDARGIRVVADRGNPLAKIDCAIAAIFCHMMASKMAQEPKLWVY